MILCAKCDGPTIEMIETNFMRIAIDTDVYKTMPIEMKYQQCLKCGHQKQTPMQQAHVLLQCYDAIPPQKHSVEDKIKMAGLINVIEGSEVTADGIDSSGNNTEEEGTLVSEPGYQRGPQVL
jgi:hypothetical protein